MANTSSFNTKLISSTRTAQLRPLLRCWKKTDHGGCPDILFGDACGAVEVESDSDAASMCWRRGAGWPGRRKPKDATMRAKCINDAASSCGV